MDDARADAGSHTGEITLTIYFRLRWNRAMASLSSELAIGELTALPCAIVLILIPPAIRLLCNLGSRRCDGWIGRGQKPIRARIN
jgi:hypothetical protein